MMKFETLAGAFENVLRKAVGADVLNVSIDVNCNMARADASGIYGVMTANRIPYKSGASGAESINVTLEFGVPCIDDAEKHARLNVLASLIGVNDGTVKDGGITYRWRSFLDFAAVSSAPGFDMGGLTQLATITGTVLVIEEKAAYIGADIKTEACIGEYNQSTNDYTELLVLSRSMVTSCEAETPQKVGSSHTTTRTRSRSLTASLTIAARGDAVCNRLFAAAWNNTPLTEKVTIKDTFPVSALTTSPGGHTTATITKYYTVTNVAYADQFGSFGSFTLTLQEA